MMKHQGQKGFTLIELMVTVAVVGILAAVALPMYSGYIETGKRGVMIENIKSIRLFEEDIRLSNGAYVAGTYDPADPDNAAGLKALISWEPRTTTDDITYVVSVVSPARQFTVTATHSDGMSEQKTFSR